MNEHGTVTPAAMVTVPQQRRLPESEQPPAHRTRRLAPAAAAGALGVLAWVVVTYPFRGDQAVFAMMGRQILHGSVLYSQLWDVKQPGVFLWYGLADLAGLGERGTRALDALAALALGPLVWLLLRRRVRSARLRRWIPALVPAAVFLATGPGDFGQLEMLCLVPATAAFAVVAAAPRRVPSLRRIAVAGLCLGVVGVFKLLLAGVVAVALLAYLVLLVPRARLLASGLVVTLFAALPVVAVLAWLAARGAFAATLHTWFVDAMEMGAAPGSRSLPRLLDGLARYCLWTAPVLLLSGWQAASALRRRDPLDLAMVVWVVATLVAVAAQFGWWYQWYFLTAPLLVLAVRRLDGIRPWRPRTVAVLALACLPMLAHGAEWAGAAVLDGGGVTAASRARIDERVADHGTVEAELAASGLRPQDSLYVLGDPLYNYLSGHPLVVRTDGWAYDLLSRRQWQGVAAEVGAARPTVVLVDPDAGRWVTERAPELRAELARDYRVVRSSAAGTWYRLGVQ